MKQVLCVFMECAAALFGALKQICLPYEEEASDEEETL